MRTVSVLVVASALALLLGAGCGKKAGSGKPKVAVSIFPIWDVTRRIAGDRLDVLLVLPPGKSEHGYDPTPKEIARLDGAKLALAVGLDMDVWVENIMRTAGGASKVVRVGDKVKTIPIDVEPIEEGEEHHDDHGAAEEHHEDEKEDHHEDEHEHEHKLGAPDPHVWMDPERMQTIVDVIAAELSAVDPQGKDTFTKNAEALKASLEDVLGIAKRWEQLAIFWWDGKSFWLHDAMADTEPRQLPEVSDE